MVQGTAAEDEIEGVVEEGQVGRVALLEEHVGYAGLAEAIGPESQEVRRQVDAHDLAHVRCDLLCDMGGATRDVEDQHVAPQWLDPAGRCGGAPGKRRIGAGEQPHLPGERLSNFLVRGFFVHVPLVHSSP